MGFSVLFGGEGEKERWIILYLSLPNQIKYSIFFPPFFPPETMFVLTEKNVVPLCVSSVGSAGEGWWGG